MEMHSNDAFNQQAPPLPRGNSYQRFDPRHKRNYQQNPPEPQAPNNGTDSDWDSPTETAKPKGKVSLSSVRLSHPIVRNPSSFFFCNR